MLNTTVQRTTLAAASIVMLALSGCATSPTGSGSGSGSGAPSATASSEAPSPEPSIEPEAASVQISSVGIAILDENGAVMDEFEFFEDEVEPAVDALTEAFGAEPVSSEVDGGVHPSLTEYAWGGFVLRDRMVGDTPGSPVYPDFAAFDAFSESAQEGTITIATKDEIAVGAAAEEVAKVSYKDSLSTSGPKLHFYRLDEVAVTGDSAGEGEGGKKAFSTIATVDPATDKVTRIFAPGANFGH